MPTLLARLRRRLGQSSWLVPVYVVLLVFSTSWFLMYLAEPDSALVHPAHYWWWFLVTAATVGYGDFFPQTTGGRLVGGYVVVGGIVTLTMIFARVAEAIENARSRRMQGLAEHSLGDHVVILGYQPGRTERIVRGVLADSDRQVVVCAWEDQAAEHPLAGDERVHFVRGDLTDESVIGRADLAHAHAVLVDARDDNEAVSLVIAAEQTASGIHTVVALRDLDRRRTVNRVDATAHCIQWHSVAMISEELQDPGIALVYQDLMNAEGSGTFSTEVPADAGGATYGEWQTVLGNAGGNTLLAFADTAGEVRVSPPWDVEVPAGARLYYVAHQRLTGEDMSGLLRPQDHTPGGSAGGALER